jgi:hypothetical protein
VSAIVNVNVSEEVSSGQSPRASGFVHRVDHEGDAEEVWALSRQTSHYVTPCDVLPHAAL